MVAAEDLVDYYRVPPDTRDLNYSAYFEQGDVEITQAQEYHSHNTHRLDVEEMKQLLFKLPFLRSIMDGRQPESDT